MSDVSGGSRPRRYVLRAVVCFAIAVAGVALGVVATAHHLSALNGLAVLVVGVALGFTVASLSQAYRTSVGIPVRAQRLAAMSQARDAGQTASGGFKAGLRVLPPEARPTRWRVGQVKMTPQSVTWAPLIGRAHDLTGLQRTGDRRVDSGFTDISLSFPNAWRGEGVRVIKLHGEAADLEVVAPAQLLEILTYTLAKMPEARGGIGP
jgi:hypothetical protein